MWPKTECWRTLDSFLALILKNSFRGKKENKVKIFNDLIFEKWLGRFGQTGKKKYMPKPRVESKKEKDTQTFEKG